VRFATDRGPAEQTGEARVQEGIRVALRVPAGASRIAALNAAGGEVWSLALGAARGRSSIDGLLAAGKKGDAQAAPRLREMAASRDAADRGPATAALGRLALARGKMDEAEPALRRAMAGARAEGRVSDVVLDATALIWGLVELQQRFADARAVLADIAPEAATYPEGRALSAFYQGVLAVSTEDLRGALSSYRSCQRASERLDRARLARDSAQELARILVTVGRAGEATGILEALEPEKDPCERLTLLINRAWASIEARRFEARTAGDQTDPAVAAALGAAPACPDPYRNLVATINAAEYALDRQDERSGAPLIERLRASKGRIDARTDSWKVDVLGRWALARGDGKSAFALFGEEVRVARGAGFAEESFRAEIGAGRSLLVQDRRPAAVAHFKAAQALLERALDGIPLAEGRGDFLSGHTEGVRFLVDALVGSGAPSEAMRVARLFRSSELAMAARLDRLSTLLPEQRRRWDQALERYARIRRSIESEAEDDWKLARSDLARVRSEREARAADARAVLDEAYRLLVARGERQSRALPELAAGEIEIALFPATNDRWFAFVRSERGVRAVPFTAERLASNQSAAPILESVARELGGAQRVRFFPYGRADAVDWQAVSWKGAPLIDTREVEYGLDLGTTKGIAQSRSDAAKGEALLVANPTRDLPVAAAEADLVARSLRGRQVARLDGAAATRDAVLANLPGASLLHYAGHAGAGSTAAIYLAAGSKVDLGDLLALPRVPPFVVLSACEAAGTRAASGAAEASMLGLAQAFAAAGTRAVVAATRAVGDAEARAFMSAFYAALADHDDRGLETWRLAYQQAARAVNAQSGSQSFRLVVQ
jgi:hypothetical protein